MKKMKQINIRINEDLYQMVKFKCNQKFGISISPLIKIFLTAFVTQKGVGFYVGDDDLCHLIYRWLNKKKAEQGRSKNSIRMPGPRLKDLYDLNNTPDERRRICQKALRML
ncbi:hypothetical protein JXD20_02320 [Candidatus Peregrinibacteria bacterium]|nr:hypothetical protein [Candidatus Peregrinibacteria bacterium]